VNSEVLTQNQFFNASGSFRAAAYRRRIAPGLELLPASEGTDSGLVLIAASLNSGIYSGRELELC
jgi:hypothetical protein